MEKTKETSNQIGKCEKCEATQFLSYGTCNYNGICNGKIIPIKTSNREQSNRRQAIAWWNNLRFGEQCFIRSKYHPQERTLNSLTGREIEEIYKSEILDKIDYQVSDTEFVLKPNQKQFVEFNGELARKYLNKFNDNSKKHFCLETFNMLSKSDLQYLKDCLVEIISEK